MDRFRPQGIEDAGRLQIATKRRAKLAAEIAELQPGEERWKRALERFETEQRDKGDERPEEASSSECEAKVVQAEAGSVRRGKTRSLAAAARSGRGLRGGGHEPVINARSATRTSPAFAARIDRRCAKERASASPR